MEPSVEASFLLPRRRSHLPSRTYRSLVRICSGFNGESRVSLATPTVLKELLLRSDNNAADKEAAQVSLKETCEPGEICPPDDTQPENSSMQESRISQKESAAPQFCNDGGSGESRIVSDDTGHVMREPTDTTYQENSLMLADIFDAVDVQDGSDGRSQKLMDELELMINGGEDLSPEDCMNLLETMDVSNGDIDMVASLQNNAKEPLDPIQNVVEKPSIATEPQGDPIEGDKKISECVDLPPEKGMAKDVSKSVDCKEGRNSGVSKNYDQTQSREMELEKSVSSSHGLAASITQMVEDEDIEEGEISGDVYIDFDDLPLENDVPVESMGGLQVTEEILNNRGSNVSYHANKEYASSSPFCAVVSPPETDGSKEQRESRDKRDAEVGNSDDRMAEDEKVENKASESHETSYKEKNLNAGSPKKKRSARSKKKNAEKKATFRKKRAEERRLLGVKRLKLKPVVAKPKPVKYCHHYLKGRCQEAEKCKFSHDIVPLTKSSPCCYFATQSCMKGDDCPFDHDLSKYPCTNFTAKGFCHRGDTCLFSHKGTSQSASDTTKSGTAASSVSPVSHSKGRPNANSAAAASFSFGFLPRKTNKRTAPDTTVKSPPAFPITASSLLAFQKPSNQPSQGNSSPKVNEHETPTRKLSVAPKGVSFLSIDKTSSDNSPKPSLHEQAGSSSIQNLLKAGFQKTAPQTTLNTNNHNLKETQQRSPLPPVPPKGVSFLSFGSDRHNGTTLANTSDAQRESQMSSQPSTSGHIWATPNTQTQKTLISALKLAAEFESGKIKRCTNDTTAVNKRHTDNTSVAANSRDTSSKILEFLSSFSRSNHR